VRGVQEADVSDRIASIRELLKASPDDVFLHYSLGMEYASSGRLERAVAEFRRCIALDGGYLAAYVEAGKALRSAGDVEAARQVLTEGLELAARLGESHMADFIRQQLDALGSRGEKGRRGL
jgi:uncharacterized protein HemY